MEGVDRYGVRLLPHNPKWDEEFLAVAEEIKNCWGKNVIAIEHIGSTAIKLICAKPILDVAVKLKSIKKLDVNAMINLGYEYCGPRNEKGTRHLFVLRGDNEISLRHIHCYHKSENEFNLVVSFRDYLNSHPSDALKYQKLKTDLAKKMPNDRAAYTSAKDEFIRSVYEKIKK